MVTRFERMFQIWEYWVSHAQLLLRSPGDLRCPPGTSEARNLDLMFVGVEYIELPAVIEGLELAESSAEDHRVAAQRIGHPVPAGHVFVLATAGRRHLVVAGGLTVLENDRELMQSSLERAQ